jgi:hypothetical protein
MRLSRRTAFIAVPVALLLITSMSSVSYAQVASLAGPEETPEPQTVDASSDLVFADRGEALLVFAQCMRDNGIAMDDPQIGQGGGRGGFLRPGGTGALDQFGEEFQVAQQACAPILEAARPDIDPEAEQERLESELALAQCFRENGYEQYPDPALDSDGRLQRGGQQFQELGIDRRSEQIQSTRQNCAEELGVEFRPGGGPGRGGN